MQQLLLVQPNFRIGGLSFEGYWLPYSVGCLWAFAYDVDWVRENFTVTDIVFKRNPIKEYVNSLEKIDLAFFSCYMWNWNYNKALAKELRRKFPDCKIVFGGPQVTNNPDREFFEQHSYIDSVVLNEGENPFVSILQNVLNNNPLEKIYKGQRVNDLDLPSPYLSGVFDKIISDNSNVAFNATLETNRGCPFQCTFCDWGSLTYAKIRKFPLEKVRKELEWMANNRMDYVTIADANFGVFYERDMLITEKLVQLQESTGFPKVVNATWYKNSTDKVINIVKKFVSSGFNRGMTLSVQSMDDTVLTEIKRKNMEMSSLKHIFDQCNKQDIKSYTELILGLPYETYDTWCEGLCKIVEAGQHGCIESWLTEIIVNAELASLEQRELHGISTVIANDYMTGFNEEDGIKEIVEIVNGTKYMPTQQMVKAYGYSWIINNFHCFGWSQVYTRFLNRHDKGYREMYDRLLHAVEQDTGFINKSFTQAMKGISNYLETGVAIDGAKGHSYLYDAQKQFHKNRQQVQKFVDNVFNQEYMDLIPKQYADLKNYQHAFTSDPNAKYPYKLKLNYNFPDFLLGEKLHSQKDEYIIDIQERNLNLDEYLNRLYNRRRQGWGKTIINKAESILPGDKVPLTPSKG